ncbi:RNA polymerase Rpb1, domain 1 family protein, partial [Vibrio harveyi]
ATSSLLRWVQKLSRTY